MTGRGLLAVVGGLLLAAGLFGALPYLLFFLKVAPSGDFYTASIFSDRPGFWIGMLLAVGGLSLVVMAMRRRVS